MSLFVPVSLACHSNNNVSLCRVQWRSQSNPSKCPSLIFITIITLFMIVTRVQCQIIVFFTALIKWFLTMLRRAGFSHPPSARLTAEKAQSSKCNYNNNGKTQDLSNCSTDKWLSVTPGNQRNVVARWYQRSV